MPKQQLKEVLEQLHTELQQSDAVSEDAQALLHTLIDDIRDLLLRSEQAHPDEPRTLIQRLEESTWQLEESHPTLTGTLGRIIDLMGRTFP